MNKAFDLTGKVFIVTGSGKGIGKGIVRCFVKSGAKCCINCNSNAAMAQETLKEIQAIGGPDCAFVYQADVSDYAQAEAMVKATYERYGRIDGLVNNAALQKQLLLDEYTLEDYDLLMHVNLGGYINMMRATLPYLKETRGSITCISSVHGKRPTHFDPVYAMTKGGMHMLMREAAIEFAKYGVRVNMV
ncbi:MAG: SDR family NAD(P)-dependent oxidoreductase, partial [Candidatus Spyradocola sp.]